MPCKRSLSGRLRHPITIQVAAEATGATGEKVQVWTTYLKARAEIGNKIGKEFFQAMQEQAEKTVGFRLRYSNALGSMNTRDYRISWNGNVYDIEDIDNVKFLNKEMVITARLHNE